MTARNRGLIVPRVNRMTVAKFELADGATQVLAGRLPPDTPRNLRLLFSRAVETKETAPRLRIEKVEAESPAACAT
jgi:hypothetical protein